MSEVLTFPTKKNHEMSRTPEEALERVLELFRSGETTADQLVVIWSDENDDRVVQNYMIGGGKPLTSAIGLLEMTKSYMLE